MELGQVGGIIGTSVAALVAWFKYARAVKERPIFINGEREAVRKALSLLGAASADYRMRLDALELASEEGRREHNRLHDQIRELRIQINRLRDQQTNS